MGFYVRKSFGSGPFRFTVSKRGVSTSVGTRGLRVSSGPSGDYLSAGMGGVYMRERLGSRSRQPQHLDSSWITAACVVVGGIFLVFSLMVFSQDRSMGIGCLIPSVVILAIPVFTSAAAATKRRARKKLEQQAAEKAAREHTVRAAAEARQRERTGRYVALLESLPNDAGNDVLESVVVAREESGLSYDETIGESAVALQRLVFDVLNKGTTASLFANRVEQVCIALGITGENAATARVFLYKRITWSALEDDALSEAEEQFLKKLRELWGVDERLVVTELQATDEFRRLRGLGKENLPVLDVGIKLPRGEVCHHKTTGSLIEERVKRSYVENGERKTEEHWVSVRDGEIYVTSKRVLIVGAGTTDIAYSKILDIEVDVDSNRVTITKDGRKAPYYLRIPDPIYTGSIIELAVSA